MMKKKDNLQLELFTQSKDTSDLRSHSSNNAFLSFIWNYEKTILIIIAVVITSIISFSLGVEKGRGLVTKQTQASPVTTNQNRPQDIAGPKEDYVIQLASYKVKTHAQREAELLKKRGLSPLVLSKGSYIVLCVGNISNKETARSLLSELKKRYRDCYIKKL